MIEWLDFLGGGRQEVVSRIGKRTRTARARIPPISGTIGTGTTGSRVGFTFGTGK